MTTAPKTFIVSVRVWSQCSAEYQAVCRLRTKAVTPETTVAEIMKWAECPHSLGADDVIITENEETTEGQKP
jgi:hypothetical protein